MSIPQIALLRSAFDESHIEAVCAVLRGQADGHAAFSKRLAELTSRAYVLLTPTCTAAIHLALATLNLQEGDEVIVADATWIASAAPICYVGAVPRFCDVNTQTWCIDASTVERKLTPRTKAVIAVDIYGSIPDYAELGSLCRCQGLALFEDAAEALGGSHGGQPAGSFGDASMFSFHSSKAVSTGEGGALLTDDYVMLQRAFVLSRHGRPLGDKRFEHVEVGFKYDMSPMQAALGAAQIGQLEAVTAAKRKVLTSYKEALSGLPISFNFDGGKLRSSAWLITAIFPRLRQREAALAALNEAGIAARPFFPPLSATRAFAHLPTARTDHKDNPVAADLSRRGLSLPSGQDLTDEEIGRVAQVIRGVL